MNIDLTDSGYYQNNSSSDNIENKKNDNCIELVKEKIFVYKCNICLLVFTCVHIFEHHIIKENHRVKQLDVLKKDKYFNCLRCKYICLSIVKIIKHLELYNHGQNILKKIKKKILYTGKAICECKIKCYSLYSQNQVNAENKEAIRNKKENDIKLGINEVNIKRGNKTNDEIEKDRNASYIYNKFGSNKPPIRYIDPKQYHKDSTNDIQIYDDLSSFFHKNNTVNKSKIRDDISTKFLSKDIPMHSFPPFCKNLSQKKNTVNSRNSKNNTMDSIIHDEVRRIGSDPYSINNKNYNICNEKIESQNIITKGNIIARGISSSSSEYTADDENNFGSILIDTEKMNDFNNNWPDLQKSEDQRNKKKIHRKSDDISHNILLDIYSNNSDFRKTKTFPHFSLNSCNEKKEHEIDGTFENNTIPLRGDANIISDDNAKITKDKIDGFRHKNNIDKYQWGMFNWELYRNIEKTNIYEPSQKIEKTDNERNNNDNKNYNNRKYIPPIFKKSEKENKIHKNFNSVKSPNEKKLLSIFIPDLVSNILGKNDEEKQNETNSYFSNISKNVTDYDILNMKNPPNKKDSFNKLANINNSDLHTQNNEYKIKGRNDDIYNNQNEKVKENITSQTNKIREHLSENYNKHEDNHTIFPNINPEHFSKIQYCDMVLNDNDNTHSKITNYDDIESSKSGNDFICKKINKIYDNLSCYETFQNELPMNMHYGDESLNFSPQFNQAIEMEEYKHINMRNKQEMKNDIDRGKNNSVFYRDNDNNPTSITNVGVKSDELLNIYHSLNANKINDTEYKLKNKTKRSRESNINDFSFLECTDKDDQNKINSNTFWEFINYYSNNNIHDGQDNKREINFFKQTEDDSWDTFTNNRKDSSEVSYNDDTIPDWIAKEVNSNNSDRTFDEQHQWKQQTNYNNIYAKDGKKCTHIFNPKDDEEISWDSSDKKINHHIDYGHWINANEKDRFGMENKND